MLLPLRSYQIEDEHLEPSFNSLTVYRRPERSEFLVRAREIGPYFDEMARAWIIADAELCRQVLSTPELWPAPAVEHYRNMRGSLGEEFPSIAFAFESIPLAMHGEAHAAGRRAMTEFMVSRREPIHQWVAEELPRHLAMLAVPGEAELMTESIRPMVRGLFAAIIGVDLPPHLMLDNISQVFDKSISVKRRRLLEEDMRVLEAHIRERLGPGCDENEVRMRIGLLVVGKDTTVGTLGECLVQLVREFPDTPLSRITYPKAPAQTGLPFVERIATAPVQVGGVELKEGDRVRVVLQTFVDAPASQHHRLFGAGPHACVGRPLTVDLWSAMCRHMGQMDTRLKLLAYELPQNEYVFNVAKTFRVEVTL